MNVFFRQRLRVAALLAPLVLALAAPARSPRMAALAERLRTELDRPEALADLIRLAELRDQDGDLQPLAAIFDAASGAREARQDVRALAHHLRAQLWIAQGEPARARAEIDQLAPIRAWAVIGPFDNDGRSGLDAVCCPPSRARSIPRRGCAARSTTSPGARCPTWRRWDTVDLDGAIWPRQDATVYAATVLPARRAQGAVLHVGASGASKSGSTGSRSSRTRTNIRRASISARSRSGCAQATTRS